MTATIIIADDYEDNLELLRLLLGAANYHVREARNGRECLTMALDNPPDLLVIDLSMPLLDGWGVLQELRSDQRTAAIPCVAVTAYGDSDRERALKTGFNAFISKPFFGGELLEAIANLLASRSAKAKPFPAAPPDWQAVGSE